MAELLWHYKTSEKFTIKQINSLGFAPAWKVRNMRMGC